MHSFLGERFATPRGTVFGIWFVPGICAFALVAVIVALSGTTTIATVPIAGTVVVTVVAHLVSLPFLLGAGPRACAAQRVKALQNEDGKSGEVTTTHSRDLLKHIDRQCNI